MKFLLPFILLFQMTSGQAEGLRNCDLSSTQAAVEKAVRDALAGYFQINGQTLSKSLVTLERVSDLEIDNGIDKTKHVSALLVGFVSPKGTRMSFRTTRERGELLQALGIDFSVVEERDPEGFLKRKTCLARAQFRGWIYGYHPVILNEVNGVIAPISDNWNVRIPNTKTSPRALMSLDFPMVLEE